MTTYLPQIFTHRFSCTALFALAILSRTPAHSQTASLPRFSGHDLRKITETTVRPEFPQEAIKAGKTGVAVAMVTVNETGIVTGVEVLEAPAPSIAQAVSQALSQWRFKTATSNGRTTGYTGKVTYYFVFQQGKAVVLDPDQTPYLGRWQPRTALIRAR